MTLIRRPGRASPLFVFPMDDEEPQCIPTRESILRAKLTRAHFESHYSSLFQQAHAREMHLPIPRFCPFHNLLVKTGPEYYTKIKLIGKGGCGQVWLARDKRTNELCAMKTIDQRKILMREQLPNLHIEQQVMAELPSPWIVSLKESFFDDRFLYFICDYIPGGDLMSALMKQHKFNEQTTRFFIGEIVMAIHFLHSNGFIHRDVKPDNVMLCEDGHIKMTDFGFTVRVNETPMDNALRDASEYFYSQITDGYGHSMNVYGTCDYISPESLTGAIAFADDYWSLGVIMYEMLFGFNPFIGSGVRETMNRVRNWRNIINYTKGPISSEAQDLLEHLICDGSERYGYEQVIAHPFFQGFDFTDWRANIPPMVPSLVCPTDTSHFDEVEQDSTDDMDSSFDDFLLCDLVRLAFMTFRYRRCN